MRPDTARAQSIQIDLTRAPLRDALDYLSLKSGVDFVYSVRLIEENKASCRYEGDSFDDALRCVLADTEVRSIALHAKQYVLAPVVEPGNGVAATGLTRQNGQVAGRIVDHETGVSLAGAHIFLFSEQRGVTSLPDGSFTLARLPRGEHRLRISYLGYQPIDTTMTTTARPAIVRMRPVTLETDGLIVEDLSPSPRSNLPIPGVLAISIQDIEAMPAFNGENDLFNTLQWTPGVRKEGGINNGLLVRGGSTDQNLYLLDGAPVYHPWHAFNLVSTFQSDTFKDIKLYRGSFPSQHGGRLSSVLDARLKDGSRSKPQARVALSALSGRFLFESPLTRRSSFMISGRRSYLDKLIGREHPVEDRSGVRDTLRTGYYFSDFTAKLAYKPGNEHRLSLTYYSGRDVLDLRLPFDVSLDFSSWLRPADLYFELDHSWGNRLYSLQHTYVISRRLLLTSTAYRTSYNATEGALIRPTSSAIVDSYYHVRVRDFGLKLDGDFFANDAHHLQFGVQGIEHAFDSQIYARVQRTPTTIDTTADTSDLHATEVAAYLEDTWRAGQRLTFRPGIRLSRFSSRPRVYVSPQINVEYIADPRWLTVRAAAGQQVQFIQRLRDRYSLVYDLVSSRWIPTSQSVRPSTGFQTSIEGESRPFPWLTLAAETYIRHADRVLIPSDAFQTKDELIGPGIGLGSLLAQYTSGESRGYGMEYTAQLRRGPWLLWLNYAGSRALIRPSEPENAAFRPTDYDAPRLFRSTLTRFFSTWNITLSTTARSGYPLTVPVARYSLAGPTGELPTLYLSRPEVNNGRLPPYVRFDLTISNRFTLIGAQWRAQLHVVNLTNRRNVIDRVYDPAQPVVKPRDLRGLPILPLFELEMEL